MKLAGQPCFHAAHLCYEIYGYNNAVIFFSFFPSEQNRYSLHTCMYHVINRYGPAGAPVFSLSAVDVDAVPAEVAARPGVLEHLVRRAGAAGLGVERGRLAPEVELVPAVEPDAVAPARAHASHAPLRPRRRAPRPSPRRQVAPRARPV